LRNEAGELETRYAVVRSVAVTAPIEALQADERHRLGVLFVLEPDADLALLTEDLVHGARGEERRRLAGLLSHGIDTLVRVLAHALARDENEAGRAFITWLSAYVERRIGVTAWLLDHWDAEAAILAGLRHRAVARPRNPRRAGTGLRARRGGPGAALQPVLDNGALARSTGDAGDILSMVLDWPATYWFPMPVRGGFGLFLEEVLVNAVRHGRPGSVPRLSLFVDRGRRELLCEVENETRRRWIDPHRALRRPASSRTPRPAVRLGRTDVRSRRGPLHGELADSGQRAEEAGAD